MSPTSREALMQLFRMTNYIGLAMVGSVFIYAGLVLGINHGYIPIKIPQTINLEVAAKVKYFFLFLSLCHYPVIKFFQKISIRAVYRLAAASIIIFTLSEIVSIYGLVLFLLTGDANNFFIFMAISLFYFYLFYPKYADWERLREQELPANPSP
jgi:F0F1-type ATP synthase membrane subunit c/vacuolar-type H+-ATPase subunit K